MFSILFLDIDGVLNTDTLNDFKFHELHKGEGKLNSNCLKKLKYLIETIPNLRIVLSSSWRISEWSTSKLSYYFNIYGIDPSIIIDKTPRLQSRSIEISNWLDNNKLITQKWIAIDDCHLSLDSFLKIDPNVGLTDENVNKIIEILKID